MRNGARLIALTLVASSILLAGFRSGTLGPYSKKLTENEARRYYVRCQNQLNSIDYNQTHHPDKPTDHPGLHLGTARGIHNSNFGTLFDHNKFIGVIRNSNLSPGPPSDDVGDGWRTTPAQSVCVFIGGDKEGLFGYLVWQPSPNHYAGVRREVVARFHAARHTDDQAKWDEDVEATFTSQMVPERFEDESSKQFIQGGSGTWYTCATNTCCKIL